METRGTQRRAGGAPLVTRRMAPRHFAERLDGDRADSRLTGPFSRVRAAPVSA